MLVLNRYQEFLALLVQTFLDLIVQARSYFQKKLLGILFARTDPQEIERFVQTTRHLQLVYVN
jgi:hypothetical protein